MLHIAAPNHVPALVHIIGADDDAQRLLTHWLTEAGIQSRTYPHLGEFLNSQPEDLPGSLVIDVVTGYAVDVAMRLGAMRTGTLDFVPKPLREAEILSAIRGAIESDRQQRLTASRHAELRARFATLTRREQQVMALVTAGMLNKQVGGDLGVAEITIKAHRGSAMRKMGARSLAELVRMADAIGAAPAVTKSGRSMSARSAVVADRHSGYTLAL